jgi:hypothetical protein
MSSCEALGSSTFREYSKSENDRTSTLVKPILLLNGNAAPASTDWSSAAQVPGAARDLRSEPFGYAKGEPDLNGGRDRHRQRHRYTCRFNVQVQRIAISQTSIARNQMLLRAGNVLLVLSSPEFCVGGC